MSGPLHPPGDDLLARVRAVRESRDTTDPTLAQALGATDDALLLVEAGRLLQGVPAGRLTAAPAGRPPPCGWRSPPRSPPTTSCRSCARRCWPRASTPNCTCAPTTSWAWS
ncbi:hypothetical protein HFP43_21125 [Streptomyces sp. SJ1-7]|nr:hypothetical protein [Streptomyces sp. SJ1-7]